jgi:hypothetical protein
VQADLVPHEPGEQLHVPGLVHGLGRRVELGVHVGDRLDDPGGHGQRSLLAVQELAEQPRGQVVAELVAFRLGQHLPLPGAVDRGELLGDAHHVGGVDREIPVDPLGGVPLLVLAPLVQVKQAAPATVVLQVKRAAPAAGTSQVPGSTGVA